MANTETRRDSLRLRGFDYASRRVYFVTTVVLGRRAVFQDSSLANATIECLNELKTRWRFGLYVYCLMPDHFHALVGPAESDKTLGQVVGAFKSLSTKLYWTWYEGRLWQARYFDHIIRNVGEFVATREYVRMNPVRKGLAEDPAHWPYTAVVDEPSWWW